MTTELTTSVGGFTVERLRTFCKVAEAGSIVAAAKGDPTRQSQMSRQVKELEEFFQAKLVERVGHSLQLTDHGRKLAVLTQSYFRGIEELRTTATREEELRIGAGESVFRWVLMPRLEALQNLGGAVRLEFLTRTTRQSIESVKSGLLDMAIVRREAVDDSLSQFPCGRLAYALVVPKKWVSPRPVNGSVLPPRLPFALHTGDGALSKGVLAMAEKLNVKLDIRVRAESSNLLVSAIEHADLAAVIPLAAVEALPKDRFVKIETKASESLARELALVFSPHAAELRDNLRRLAPKLSALLSA